LQLTISSISVKHENISISVNAEYVFNDAIIPEEAEIALCPQVSAG
jgi:hypothetical protein